MRLVLIESTCEIWFKIENRFHLVVNKMKLSFEDASVIVWSSLQCFSHAEFFWSWVSIPERNLVFQYWLDWGNIPKRESSRFPNSAVLGTDEEPTVQIIRNDLLLSPICLDIFHKSTLVISIQILVFTAEFVPDSKRLGIMWNGLYWIKDSSWNSFD